MNKEPLIEQHPAGESRGAGPRSAQCRRDFLKAAAGALGAVLVGGLSKASAQYYPLPGSSQPYLPPEYQPGNFGIEIPAGITPQVMVATARQFVDMTVDGRLAGQVVEARPLPRPLQNFHDFYGSDFALLGPIPPTRTRFGYFLELNQFLRSDSTNPPRVYKDLNFYEMRRVMHPTEISNYGMVMHPCGFRMPPTSVDRRVFIDVAYRYYGLPRPEDYTVLYRRRFSAANRSFWGYFVSVGLDPLRSPYKDLFIDNRPI